MRSKKTFDMNIGHIHPTHKHTIGKSQHIFGTIRICLLDLLGRILQTVSVLCCLSLCSTLNKHFVNKILM